MPPLYLFSYLSLCSNSLFLISVAIVIRCLFWCDHLSILIGWDTISDLPQVPRYVPNYIVCPPLHHHLYIIPASLSPFFVLLCYFFYYISTASPPEVTVSIIPAYLPSDLPILPVPVSVFEEIYLVRRQLCDSRHSLNAEPLPPTSTPTTWDQIFPSQLNPDSRVSFVVAS